jgi:hypothetical protein
VFILFGFRSFVKALAVLTTMCQRCRHQAAQRVVQRSRWFTLFFIPVIPVSFTRYTVCTRCGVTLKISKDDAQRLVTAASAAPVPGAAPAAVAQPQHAAPER